MEHTGGGQGAWGIYVPNDPDGYDQIDTGPPSLYVDPASVQAAPFNPQASPIEPVQLPYQPLPPPESWDLEDQPVLRG